MLVFFTETNIQRYELWIDSEICQWILKLKERMIAIWDILYKKIDT